MPADASFFRDLAYVLLAAGVGGGAAWLARQPLVVGYVLGGILVSPFTPGPVVSEVHTFELFAEIGVILLMFFIGAEFSPQELLRLKWVGFVGGTLGILVLMALGFGAVRLLGWPPVPALIVGMIVSTASTLVLVRLLLDRGELHARHGRVAVGITLVDDLAVVIFIILIPSLGVLEPGRFAAVGLALGKAVAILLPFGVLAAKVFPRLLAQVARTQSRELFLMVTLVISVGTAALSQAVGLSLALGAFLAGLIVSGSDYAHEALARLLPLRDVFVAVFFVTVGVLIDPRTLLDNVPLVGTMVGLVTVGKLVVWTLLVRLFRETWRTALLVAVSLTQIGEFAFLLARAGMSAGHLDQAVFNATLLTALLTILLNAVLLRIAPGWIAGRDRPRPADTPSTPRRDDSRHGHVILCGFGALGSAVGEALETFMRPFLVVETDPDIIRGLASRGIPALYGDAQQERILEDAGLARAAALIVTLPEGEAAYGIVRAARTLHREVPILVRAASPEEQQRLRAAGATGVVQPRLEGAVFLIRETLAHLGLPTERTDAYLDRFREAMDLPVRLGPSGPDVLPELREVQLSAAAELADQSLLEARVRERFGVLVLAIRRADGTSMVNPSPETPLRPGDRLRVFGLPAQLAAFEEATGGGATDAAGRRDPRERRRGAQ
ncbi:MAG TPA: cation:proton antiporter [Candidatus Methylomirabilis sp.]|nr:cation:proton antiporter [Candidatus Methylomirabilis sp.]